MKPIHFLNGNFVSEAELLITPRDLGFSRGYAVFEFLRTYGGRPFLLERHLDRLGRSAELIGMLLPWDNSQLSQFVHETLSRNLPGRDYALRIIISGGLSFNLRPNALPSIIIIVDQAITFPPELYSHGIKAKTIRHSRYLPHAKTTNYIAAVSHMSAAESSGYSELLYLNDKDELLEGATSNVFFVTDERILSPRAHVLEGITRSLLLKTFPTRITLCEISLTSIHSANEAFLTVSGKGIVPLVAINEFPIGEGIVGPVTKEMMSWYSSFASSGNW